MAITTCEGLLETWADEIETIEQNLENLYGPATITPVLPSVTTEDGLLEAAAEGTELSAWNFAKMYNYMSAETNTTRIVDVPDTALYYGQLAKIGGHTIAESGELLSAEVTNVISKSAGGKILQVYPIPAEVQAIEGYGWSAGTAYNYIDFVNKKFVKCVDRVDMGALGWVSAGSWYYSNSLASVIMPISGASTVGNLLTALYTTVSYNKLTGGEDKTISYGRSTSPMKYVMARDSEYATVAAFQSAMSGQYLYYELLTPVETDISSYLTDTDIKVEAGGTLTFDNSNDLDVPSEVKYIS